MLGSEKMEEVSEFKYLGTVLCEQPVKKALIVTDENLVKLGILDSLFKALDSASIPYALYDKVTPNPTATLVRNGLAFYEKEGCDCFIAVGGGSPTDCAKGIRILASNEGEKGN